MSIENKILSPNLRKIKYCIANFNIKKTNYIALKPSQLGLSGCDSNTIYTTDGKMPSGLRVNFDTDAKNCSVFISDNTKFSSTRISMKSKNNIVYIGGKSNINGTAFITHCENDFIIVGEGVCTVDDNFWGTGFNPGELGNGIVIGDHCLFATEIVIRAADGHPVIDLATQQQVNKSLSAVFIEPYCWIGQRVSILKNVHIGACSILAFNAVVTKPASKFSMLSGVPARSKSLDGKLWLRNHSKECQEIYDIYKNRYYKLEWPALLSDINEKLGLLKLKNH
ncbi:hypothetical protein CIG19_06100 [Enterobacterales bacterium CwR94]|nr:hypothetical protein CIG19_06100 [Enterobacterales bacterium CwR94]